MAKAAGPLLFMFPFVAYHTCDQEPKNGIIEQRTPMHRLLSATIGVLLLCSHAQAIPIINQRLETTDLLGSPITTIDVGESFQLRGYVQDLRLGGLGVFAFWSDVVYDRSLASVPGAGSGPAPVVFGPTYPNGQNGDTSTPGLIDEVGAFDGSVALGGAEVLQWIVPFTADAAGVVSFNANQPDGGIAVEPLLFDVNTAIPFDEVQFGTAVLTIGAGLPDTRLMAWAQAAGLSGPNALPNAIPWGDGVPNLVKYAFNMNGGGPDTHCLVPGTGTSGLPFVWFDDSGPVTVFRFEYIRRKNSGLVYTPKQSTTLGSRSWVPMTGTPTVTDMNPEWERVSIEHPFAPAVTSARFFLVEVALP